MIDRRHDPDPLPPDGIERRYCSDSVCRAAREEWFTQSVLPKLLVKFGALFGSIMLSAVTVLSGVFIYMSKNAIRDFALEAKSQYVSIPLHQSDISRIERKVESLESNLSDQMQDIAEKLDRNYSEFKGKR